MYQIFTELLINKELSKVMDLFTIPDECIVNDLNAIVNEICKIITSRKYVDTIQDQSIVEICIKRILNAIRDTGSMEQQMDGLIQIVDSCLDYTHKPSKMGETPPHAKISSEIISFLFFSFEVGIPQLLCEYLNTEPTDIQTMNIFLNIAKSQTRFLSNNGTKNTKVADSNSKAIHSTAQILLAISKLNKSIARQALIYIYNHSLKLDLRSRNLLVHETMFLCFSYPELFTYEMLEKSQNSNNIISHVHVNQVDSCKSIKSDGKQSSDNSKFTNTIQTNSKIKKSFSTSHLNRTVTSRHKLMTHSMDRLKYSKIHHDMTRVNTTKEKRTNSNRLGSIGGLHQNITKQSSNQIHTTDFSNNNNSSKFTTSSHGITLTPFRTANYRYGAYFKYPVGVNVVVQSPSFTSRMRNSLSHGLTRHRPRLSRNPRSYFNPVEIDRDNYSTVILRANQSIRNTTHNSNIHQSRSEPPIVKDTIQNFCNKHLEKIKIYMSNIAYTLPPPVKCTIEERKSKKVAKISFGCEYQGVHCLHDQNMFTVFTRYPHVWIYLMFLDIQSGTTSALGLRDPLISALKDCWDILECEPRSFTVLVTSAFPSEKIIQNILNELRFFGYFDLFDHCILNEIGTGWNCILCNRPEQVAEFLNCNEPVVESQLKKKKCFLKLFKVWETRIFSLTGSNLSYKKSVNNKEGYISISIDEIIHIKVRRDYNSLIPKSYEIFTAVGSFILKPNNHIDADRWAQCLSVIVAHSRSQRIKKKKK